MVALPVNAGQSPATKSEETQAKTEPEARQTPGLFLSSRLAGYHGSTIRALLGRRTTIRFPKRIFQEIPILGHATNYCIPPLDSLGIWTLN